MHDSRIIGYRGKRVFDIVAAGAALVVLSPIMLLGAALVRLTMGRPIFFLQRRPGLNSKPFTLLKLRTMSSVKDANGSELPDNVRLTPVGRLLRFTSMDELPQLINVLRGEMSLIGPRPLLIEYLPRYTADQARRHLVRPGITGWAQVNGRHDIYFSRRLQLDTEYVTHCSPLFDLKILALTIPRMIGSGVRNGQDVREVDDLGLATITRQTAQNRQESL